MALRLLAGAALLTLADAAPKCVTQTGADFADTTSVTTTPNDATLCTLSPSTDYGVTAGTCAAAGATATCAPVAGSWAVTTADSCTSTMVAGGATAASDETNCALTSGDADFDATTVGTCAATDSAVATCAYVDGAYAVTLETCTSTTPVAVQKAACDTSVAGVQWVGEHAQESAIKTSPRRKTWWTKRLTSGTGSSAAGDAAPVAWDRIYTGGQPSERDLKMMYEQGFDGVYSLWPFPTSGGGKEIESGLTAVAMPTGTEARAAAADAGLLYGMIPMKAEAAAITEACEATDGTDDTEGCAAALVAGCATSCSDTTGCTYTAPVAAVTANTPIDWTSTESIDAVEKFMDFALANTDGPIYLHCYIGRTSTVALQAYRARKAAAAAGGPAIVAQAGKSITQTAIIEASYHGFDLTNWEAVFAREAGETVNVAAVTTPAVTAATEGCDATDAAGETAGTTTCNPLIPASGAAATCDAVAASCTVLAGAGTCVYRAARCAAPEVTVTPFTGTAGATPVVGPTVGLPQYHWLKPLGTLANGVQLYDAGQIHAEHLGAIRAAGIVSVVNMRKQGPLADGSDDITYVEETNLLNVKSTAKTKQAPVTAVDEACAATDENSGVICTGFTAGTASTCTDITGCSYTAPVTGVTGYRNDAAWLADTTAVTGGSEHVLEADRADGWTTLAGQNFEVLNAHEFGVDATRGYDQRAEAAAFAATDSCTVVGGTCSQEATAATTCTKTTGTPGSCAVATGSGSCVYVPAIRYVNLPVGGSMNPSYNAEGLVAHSAGLIEAINHATANNGHVLFHCRTGYRTGAFPSALLSALGIQTGTEVAERMTNIGYDEATIEGKNMHGILAGVAGTTWTPATPPAGSAAGTIAGALTATWCSAQTCPTGWVADTAAASTMVAGAAAVMTVDVNYANPGTDVATCCDEVSILDSNEEIAAANMVAATLDTATTMATVGALTCAAGFSGTVSVTVTSGAALTLSGCTAIAETPKASGAATTSVVATLVAAAVAFLA